MPVSLNVKLKLIRQQKWPEASPSHRIREQTRLFLLGNKREEKRREEKRRETSVDFTSSLFLVINAGGGGGGGGGGKLPSSKSFPVVPLFCANKCLLEMRSKRYLETVAQ